MILTLIRVVILYLLIVISMRIMGKRQIGELHPTELVVTIILSEIAAIPLQDNEIPLLNSISAILLLVAFELISSLLIIKSVKFRKLLLGNSLIVIRDGKIDLEQMKRLRFSLEDLLETLRGKDIFDISEVQYAILETNGQVSVMLKPEYNPATAGQLGVPTEDCGVHRTVLYDGKIVADGFADCGLDEKKLLNMLKKKKLTPKDVVLMTANKAGEVNIVLKTGVIEG